MNIKKVERETYDSNLLTFTLACFVLTNSCNWNGDSLTHVDNLVGEATKKSKEEMEGNILNESVFVDADDEYICGDISEYQQVQAAETVGTESENSVDEESEESGVGSDAGCGNLAELSDGEWNAVCGDEDGVCRQDVDTKAEARSEPHADDGCVESDEVVTDDAEESDSTFMKVTRHSRDPTYPAGEDDFAETGYLEEGPTTKSLFSIKHPRSVSKLLHDDARKLLRVSRGVRACTAEEAADDSALWREYVEDAALIHEDVFRELRRIFPDSFQLQRLLLLEGVTEWDGWASIKSVLSCSPSDAMKRVHVEEFVDRFVRRCQKDCVYDGFPSDADRIETLKKSGYALKKVTGHGCNSLIDSCLLLLLHFKVINGPPPDANLAHWRHEACEEVRKHLCNHSDVTLHPRFKSRAGEAVAVESDVHQRAFLQHRTHVREVVTFLISKFNLQNPNYVRSFRVVVFSRFDCPAWGDDVIEINFPGGEEVPVQELHLYHYSKTCPADLQYDAMVFRLGERRSKVSPVRASSSSISLPGCCEDVRCRAACGANVTGGEQSSIEKNWRRLRQLLDSASSDR